MKNYKINIDKPKPTQEEILAGRNFDSVLAQYKATPGQVIKKPFWQSAGFIGSVVAVAATVAIVVMVVSNDGNDEVNNPGIVDNNAPDNNGNIVAPDSNSTPAWTATKRTIAPPLANVNVGYQEYKVSPNTGGTISYPTGTKIRFQPNSFVDKNGAPVTGNVDVKYREMHDAVDFFLAGVPMEYDSAGQTYIFESAGMMEVAAFVNGEVVYLDKNKPMQVEMASTENATSYNLYHFDTEAGNWIYQGKDKVAPMPYTKEQRMNDSLAALQMWLATQGNAGPVCGGVYHEPKDAKRPLKADPKKNRFVVDFSKEEFPEMANYQNVIFEVDESKEKFDPANYNLTWELVTLSRGDTESRYKLTLRKGLRTVKLDVYPVLDGGDYDEALVEYEKAHAKYLVDSAAFKNWVAATLLDPTLAVLATNPNAFPPPRFVFDPQTMRNENLAYDVQRTFELSGFGFYNCDRPAAFPKGSVLNLSLNGPDSKPFAGTQFYHVDRAMNTIMTCYNPASQFFVNTKSRNLVWAVNNGELYYAENEQFSGLPFLGQATITLQKVAKQIRSAAEMRAFFNIAPAKTQ